MTDDTEKPELIRDAEAFLKQYAFREVAVSVLFTAAVLLSTFGAPAFGLVGMGIGLGGSFAAFIGYLIWKSWALGARKAEAVSLVETYNSKKAALMIAQDIISPEQSDLGIQDKRWDGTKALLGRVRKLAGGDATTLIVIDDIAEYLIDAFQAVASLEDGLKAERALDQETPDCLARQARIQTKLDQRNQQADALISALRDVHVELTMRDDGDHEGLSEKLRDVFFRVQAENEVREDATPPQEQQARLPKEETASDASATRSGQKETT